jgi:protocatechuate 3,4-dioxygenase beta subunit
MQYDHQGITRRTLIAAAGAAAISRPAGAQDDVDLIKLLYGDGSVPVIAMTDSGPLYPPTEIPWNGDLTMIDGKRSPGQVLYFFGQIMSREGRPLPNAVVEIWQTDINGNYKHPRGWGQDELLDSFGYFGKVRTDDNGLYVFKTIQPRWYRLFGMPRAAHIHMRMLHADHGVLNTEAYFQNASHEEVYPEDQVFLRRPPFVRDRIVLPEDSPEKHAGLGIEFEPDAVATRYDLAFLL